MNLIIWLQKQCAKLYTLFRCGQRRKLNRNVNKCIRKFERILTNNK